MAMPLSSQQLRFKHITSEEGLSTNFVNTIIQDELGFIWIGTQDGLNKYDGYQIRIFQNDPTNENSLTCSDVTTLKQIAPNLIIVGTREGLNLFNPISEKFSAVSNKEKIFKSKVNAVYEIDKATVLVGSEYGLYLFYPKTNAVKQINFPNNINVSVKALEKVGDKIFVATGSKGLWILNKNNTLENVAFRLSEFSANKLNLSGLESITQIGQYGGNLYLGTNGFGIYKVDLNFEVISNISFGADEEGTSDYVRDFIIRKNRLYAATANGVFVFNLLTQEVRSYTRKDNSLSLNSNPCNCIYADAENNFWIGTDLGGVNVSFFRSQKFPRSAINYEKKYRNIYALLEDTLTKLIVGGVGLLHEIDLETGKTNVHDAFLNNATVLTIEKQAPSIYWVGTWGSGLYRYDMVKKKAQQILKDETGGTIVALKIVGDFLYAGSIGDGLFRVNINTLKIEQFTENNGLPASSVNSIFKDSKNCLWLGTSNDGLIKLKALDSTLKLHVDRIYQTTAKNGQIASNMVLATNEDAKGNIWVATSGGLSKLLPDGTFRNFYAKHGLSNTYLYALLRDSVNHFWMSSNAGIMRFDPLKPVEEIEFKNYGVKDGLVNTEYNMGAAFTSTTGMMYFGGARGFNAFRPTTIKANLHVPEAYVISYKRGGTDVTIDSLITYKKHLILNWDENYFQFELVAIDYTDPEKNKFKYKLEGYDHEWSAPTSVRFVSYTELGGGDYTFKVKACNNDGIWNERPFEIKITVVPPFWKTNTFYIFVTLLLLSGLYGFTQYRTKAIKRENRILEAKVAERTRELEEKNRDITSSITYAKRLQEAILPSKDHIFNNLKKVFILYQPKDIVSGDFYWFAELQGVKIFAVVDCTGHGVPGAFMSMIGHNLLNQIVLERLITDPGEILNQLHRGVQEAFRQGNNEISTNDGMDVSLIAINSSKNSVKWAGANRPLVLVDPENNLSKFDGNKYPIGGAQLQNERVFTTHDVPFTKGSMAYMSTDGYADQFGGDRGKKFMVKRFHEILSQIHNLNASLQEKALRENFEKWKANHEQVDDVLIVGIEI